MFCATTSAARRTGGCARATGGWSSGGPRTCCAGGCRRRRRGGAAAAAGPGAVLGRGLPAARGGVVDVGGGPGVHAEWLAADGHVVELVDPVPLHVEQASRVPGVTARHGDARDLPMPGASADAVLLLGPL